MDIPKTPLTNSQDDLHTFSMKTSDYLQFNDSKGKYLPRMTANERNKITDTGHYGRIVYDVNDNKAYISYIKTDSSLGWKELWT